MLPIIYPDDLDAFKKAYRKIFEVPSLQKRYDAIWKSSNSINIRNLKIENIITGDFNALVLIATAFRAEKLSSTQNQELKELFDYDSSQPKIADFFVKYNIELKLSTCYFCNIDFINAFTDFSDYSSYQDFLNHANKSDLEKIPGIGNTLSEKILKVRRVLKSEEELSLAKVKSISGVGPQIIKSIKSLCASSTANHFTLDHLIDKASFPILALSLFNLVPCCYSCNSKFKKSAELIDINNNNCAKVSPTSKDFDFHKKNKFKLFYKARTNSFTHINKLEDFTLRLVGDTQDKQYESYIDIFKLNARYRAHKVDVLDLVSKISRYSPKKINQISELLGVEEKQVYEDIIGTSLKNGELNEKPKTKLLRDISENIKGFNE